jgi:polyvinyl alcohol dehydrogenase (cytochrome)
LFEEHCAQCHNAPGAGSRAPNRDALRYLTPEAILDALTSGSMAPNAQSLSLEQKRTLAEYLAGRTLGSSKSGEASAMPNHCPGAPSSDPLKGASWNGWGVDLGNSRFQPAAAAGLTPDQVPKLKLKWAFGFPNATSMYGQPTVAGGRVYAGSDAGFVYALSAASGCVYWSFQAQAGVRTAISIGPVQRGRYAAYFGDVKAKVYAVDAATGALLWTKRADSHPLARITGAPALHDGRLYVPVASLEELAGGNPAYECCTFRGSLIAYDASTGDQIWKTYTISEEPKRTRKTSRGTQLWGPAGAAIWSTPAIDLKRSLLYVATGDAYTAPAAETSDAVMAFEMKTGKVAWSKQLTSNDAFVVGACGPNAQNRSETCPEEQGPDFDFGNAPILQTLGNGRDIIVIGQKSGIGWALDPAKQGAVLWQHRVGKGSALGGIEWGSAADGQVVYFPNADASYGPEQAGGLAAVKIESGERVWFTRPPAVKCSGPRDPNCIQAQSAAVTVIPGIVFSASSNGILRAYATKDGSIVWEYNTSRDFTTVNKVPASGGAINGPGPTVAGGMLFVTSGYTALGGGKAGNVLLAFGAE